MRSEGLLARATFNQLAPEEVILAHQPRLNLYPADLAKLGHELAKINNPMADPIPDAIREQNAKVGSANVQLPGLGPSHSAASVAEGVTAMNPKSARLITTGSRYEVQARLNPWVSVATGNILHGLSEPTEEPRHSTPHPSLPDVVWHASNLVATPSWFNSPTGDDGDWTPEDVMQQGMATSAANPTPYERLSASLERGTTRVPTGAGPVNARSGWGGQPYITSRRGDFGGARAATDYPHLVEVIHALSPVNQEELANQMLLDMEGQQADFSGLTNEQLRAVAMLIGITQVAEEHPRRTPGAAAFARAGLRAVADGYMTFEQAFGAMPFVGQGGAQNMRNTVTGNAPLDSDQQMIAGLMDHS